MAQTQAEILQELIDQHPDVVERVEEATAENWIRANWPWLPSFIDYNNLDRIQTVKAAISFSFEWGVQFEKLNGRPPGDDDWKAAYYNNCNAFADRLGLLKPFDKPENRLRLEYGGPY